MDGGLLAEVSLGELTDAVVQLQAAEGAIRQASLEVIAEIDRREEWQRDGASCVEGWLCAQLGVSSRTASELVRVARALEDLPGLAAVFSGGRLSWDQIRALTRFVDGESDAEWAERAPGWSAAQLERWARRKRRIDRDQADRMVRERSVRWWWEHHGLFRLSGRLPSAEGAMVVKALETLANGIPPDPATGFFEPYQARCADALVQMASGATSGDGTEPGRATVVVHVDADAAVFDKGNGEVEHGPVIPLETVRRLGCDGRWQAVAHGPDGRILGIGRTSRRVPGWLQRQIRHRDGGCRFPGCGRTRWTDTHHLVHWTHGGPTQMDNLATLCGYHHRLVHENGWRISGNPQTTLAFIRPDGNPYTPGPQPLRPQIRKRIVDPIIPRARAPG